MILETGILYVMSHWKLHTSRGFWLYSYKFVADDTCQINTNYILNTFDMNLVVDLEQKTVNDNLCTQ